MVGGEDDGIVGGRDRSVLVETASPAQQPGEPEAPPPARPAARRRRPSWVARLLLAVAAPLLFFGLVEALLAAVGFGGRPPLFVASPSGPGMLEANPEVAQRYFPGRETLLAIEPTPFLAEKSPDTIRLVVQGGSTAAGFPYGRFAGLAGMLEDRLEAARPEQSIEVITTAMAAVNSYTLLDFVDEIIEIEPDAVLVYAGHNEYLGIFGAGSALTTRRSRAATRWHLALGRFRVYQWIDLLIPAAAEASRQREAQSAPVRGTLMAHAATSAEIPLDSQLFREGQLQFEENLGLILAAYADAGIPVFVATLASNEVDQAPFVGGPIEAGEGRAFEGQLARARELAAGGDRAGARAELEALVARWPAAATGFFELARLQSALGEREGARAHYRRAKELDRLRFRAPEASNEVIRALADRHGSVLVDVQARLEAQAPLGRVGRELMLEHLHPNALGYFLLADAFYQSLETSGLLGPAPETPAPSLEAARRDMPLTAIDHLNAAQRIREITSDFPFRPQRVEVTYPEPTGPVEEIARDAYREPSHWLAANERLLQHYLQRGEFAKALVVARVTARVLPGEAAPNRAAARLLARAGRARQAVLYQERALRAEPDDLATLQGLRRMVERTGDLEEAARLAERVEALEAAAAGPPEPAPEAGKRREEDLQKDL